MSMTKRKVAFIHTSPAAISPVMQFYTSAAPEFEITNLLDDGLLRLLAAHELTTTSVRLADMLEAARTTYAVELAMITCSSVPQEMAEQLGANFKLPVLKIDYPMARQAVRAGRRIGVAATFAPTLGPTSQLITRAAAEAGVEVEIIQEATPQAYDALLAGDTARHDELLLALVERLQLKDVAVVVLAQVSMARIMPQVTGRISVPVLTSLHTSLAALRSALDETQTR